MDFLNIVNFYGMHSGFNAFLSKLMFLEHQDFTKDPYRNRRDKTKILSTCIPFSALFSRYSLRYVPIFYISGVIKFLD